MLDAPARLRFVEQAPPTRLLAFASALVAGILLATGHLLAGGALVVVAIACAWAWVSNDGDERGLF